MYKRYSNPIQLLQQMLEIGDLTKFIDNLIEIILDDRIERTRWDYWLHRVFEMGFDEYVTACENNMKQAESDTVELKEVIKDSYEMMENFHPN